MEDRIAIEKLLKEFAVMIIVVNVLTLCKEYLFIYYSNIYTG